MVRKSKRLAEGNNCRIFPKDMIVEILSKKRPREEHGLFEDFIKADDETSVYEPS